MLKILTVLCVILSDVLTTVEVHFQCMDETGNRHEFSFHFDGVGWRLNGIVCQAVYLILIETDIVSVSQEGMIAGIVVPYLVEYSRDVCRGVLFLAFGHVQWIGDGLLRVLRGRFVLVFVVVRYCVKDDFWERGNVLYMGMNLVMNEDLVSGDVDE